MKNRHLDRLLTCAASVSELPDPVDPEVQRALENQVLARLRGMRAYGDAVTLLRMLRTGLALAGAAALCTILISVGTLDSGSTAGLEDPFVTLEPEAYLALQ
ncbi:MAG: hypothetical protein EXS25_12185 [Pedosphaera sp.]|nr:hypothetical protein [Pedosphaera sp.]